ncbi:peptidoglycan-recognition protein 3-like [Macrosteles quadrilineatus]|uniref:peptidoglycan-recognition protein 3-like n=1 Tax=Macrosteles quadrilineatus TaxID=74068 RepID=UPI0023E23B8D|nr:peptidoglycan-recognition protein 3-like [Macrosteles quadrilineatus]
MSSSWWNLDVPLLEEPDPYYDDGIREIHEHTPRIVTRDDWDADDVESEDEERLEDIDDFPIPYIVAMHTRTRPCTDKDDCKRAVKEIQQKHLAAGEPDILYNFLIDQEGFIFIGRGPAIHGITFPEDDDKLKKANRKCIVIGYIGNGGIEPPDLLVEGSASLLALLMDGKYIDEDVQYLWYHHPVKGLPPEDDEDRKKTDLDDMMEAYHMDYARGMFSPSARAFDADENL